MLVLIPSYIIILLYGDYDKLIKTDVTPAILSRDFVEQLYFATKLQV